MHTARFVIIGTVTTLAIGLGAAPAAAAPNDPQVVTFEIVAGSLDITASADADLGTFGAPGTASGGALGAVAVADGRAAADADWAATVTSSNFLTGTGLLPEEIILATEVQYWSGGATAGPTGTGTFTPGQALVGNAAALHVSNALAAYTHTGGTGNNTVAWNPTLIVNTPLDSVAGDYTGTVTHSVA